MHPLFDHIDLRVTNLARAREFYDGWLPALGLTAGGGGDDWKTYRHYGDPQRMPFIWMVEEANHRANRNQVALYQPTKEDVLKISELALKAGAKNFEPGDFIADYGKGYFAAFFEDADGNRWEICCRHGEEDEE